MSSTLQEPPTRFRDAAKSRPTDFQAEVRELLKLMIHSLYSHREIFLRELISNASDANDRLRFAAIAEPRAAGAASRSSRSRIEADADAGTVTIRDNGIGMTREEAIANLGTIARSGTRRVLPLPLGGPAEGLRAHRPVRRRLLLRLHRRRPRRGASRARPAPPAEAGVRWESSADGDFTVETVTRAERGTAVTLHLKADAKEFADAFRLRSPDPPLLRPHRLPGAHAQGGRGLARVRGGEPGEGAVDAAAQPRSRTRNTSSSTSTSRTTSPTRSPGATTRSRASASTRACCTSPAARRSTCGSATPRAA